MPGLAELSLKKEALEDGDEKAFIAKYKRQVVDGLSMHIFKETLINQKNEYIKKE